MNGRPELQAGHPQLFRFWSQLTLEQQSQLLNQLNSISPELLKKQRSLIESSPQELQELAYEAVDEFTFSGDLDHRQYGQELIEQGLLGCLLLAGGHGTRLQSSGPKGTYPISNIKHKSLFQLCAEKVKAASARAGRRLDLAVMTSTENDVETRSFFQQHQFFGLDPSQISFFIQENLPLLDASGHLFLQKTWEIAMGSNGNGASLLSLAQSGILKKWSEKGVKYLNVILIDNPLADPFDAELLGFHCRQNVEITLKGTEKIQPEEKVGLLVKREGRYAVIEYNEMSEKEKRLRGKDGRLKHCCANLSLFCFSFSFIQRMITNRFELPLHKAWKAAKYVDTNGHSQFSEQPMAWKFETFIFDWLEYTDKVAALIYPRNQCFAPLKNAKGDDSPETVRSALQETDRNVIQSITGIPAPEFPFELSAEFYYPTPGLLSRWRGKVVVDPYARDQ